MARPRLGVWEIYPFAGASVPLNTPAYLTFYAVSQVLISIQSMILCDEPYLNEPGWAGLGGSPQSKACEYQILAAPFQPCSRYWYQIPLT